MPHLFSGLNQKRQGGKITNGTFVVGSTKSRGSSTRMVSHCKSNSENSSDCVNTVLHVAKQNPQIIENGKNQVRNNDLFNRDTFSRYFNLYGEGEIWTPEFGRPIPTPEKYIIGLNNAADRWGKFLKVSDNATYFIRTNSIYSKPEWNGIELTGLKIDTDAKETDKWLAKIHTLNSVGNTDVNTGIITGFTLQLNTAKIEALGYDDTDIANILTHELGHALGICGPIYKSINVAQNREIQPLIIKKTEIETEPYVFRPWIDNAFDDRILEDYERIFYNLIWEYVNYDGVVFKNKSLNTNEKSINKVAVAISPYFMPLSVGRDGSTDGAHWRTDTLYTKNYYDNNEDFTLSKYYCAGIVNDIMAPSYDPFMEYFISRLSIGRLTDLRNETDVGTIYNYTELNMGASEDTGNTKTDSKCIMFTGPTKSINNEKNMKNGKNIKNANVIVCDCCPIIINDVTSIGK
jgi:hypothetical protein